jgi:prepilin-type N-terminal cleavage/methylation domain-containing protein
MFAPMNVRSPRLTSTRGMTIIELAITISILGILMYFTLKGTAVIQSMRSVAVAYELQQYQRLFLAYQTDFRQFPGDDPGGAARWRREPALTTASDGTLVSLQGNGQIDGVLYDFGNPAAEQFTAWRDLRAAGMVSGDSKLTGASALPENPFGGFYGVDEGNLGQTRGSLCATKIPGLAAQAIDSRIDDGKINTGNIVATANFSISANNHFDAPDTEPYNVEKEYIICLPLLP